MTSVSKHTPGPLDWVSVGANASGGSHVYIVDSTGRKIAALWGKADEKIENARLWTASPDLLEFARSIAEADAEGHMLPQWMGKAAREVIAKATRIAP